MPKEDLTIGRSEAKHIGLAEDKVRTPDPGPQPQLSAFKELEHHNP